MRIEWICNGGGVGGPLTEVELINVGLCRREDFVDAEYPERLNGVFQSFRVILIAGRGSDTVERLPSVRDRPRGR